MGSKIFQKFLQKVLTFVLVSANILADEWKGTKYLLWQVFWIPLYNTVYYKGTVKLIKFSFAVSFLFLRKTTKGGCNEQKASSNNNSYY